MHARLVSSVWPIVHKTATWGGVDHTWKVMFAKRLDLDSCGTVINHQLDLKTQKLTRIGNTNC